MRWLLVGCIVLCAAFQGTVLAAEGTESIRLVDPKKERWQVGVIVRARQGAVTGIVATLPVPRDWPEQQVTVVSRDVSPQVKSARFRELDGGARQWVVTIGRLRPNEEARAMLTLDIVHYAIVAPDKTDTLHIPTHPARSLAKYLKPSPYIDSQDRKIQQLARSAAAGRQTAWAQVEAIYDLVREKIQYRFDKQIKSARAALDEGFGDCEELSSLFIAMCRAIKVPARLVWVPGHCYPEFFLVDSRGEGHWYPCQAAGIRAFGGIGEYRPILQKGDAFRIPGKRGLQRYAHETLSAKNAVAPPAVEFVRKPLASESP